MNIFVLDASPQKAARMLCDKHVVKMILESAQILSTVWFQSVGPRTSGSMYDAGLLYRPTHEQHPCVKWAAASADNYVWLAKHAYALCLEYSERYGKIHKSQRIIETLSNPPMKLPRAGRTAFVQCMPEEYRQDNPVEAYRAYYKGAKTGFAQWNHSQVPSWWSAATAS